MTTSKPNPKKKNLLIDHPRWAERLSEEYDYEANEAAGLELEELTAGGDVTIFWRCRKCGGAWSTCARNRTTIKTDCPYCCGKRALQGYNDLESQKPEIAREWVEEENGISASQIPIGSQRKGIWECSVCGGRWSATVYHRVKKNGRCPYCLGRKVLKGFNDLQTQCVEVSSQWHPSKNGLRTPDMFLPNSSYRAWWLCPVCGGDWPAIISQRTRNDPGCPYCNNRKVLVGYNDLVTTHPDLVAEIHPSNNEGVEPRALKANSSVKLNWLCPECGNDWDACVYSRALQGNGCPYCAGEKPRSGVNDLGTTNKILAAQWNPDRNGTLQPVDVLPFSHRKVWWLCPECGFEWKATVASRSNGSGCPKCAKSRGERDVVYWAEERGFLVCEQWRHSRCHDKQLLPFDAVLSIPVVPGASMEICHLEYDGEQHCEPGTYFNLKNLERGRGLDYVVRHDAMKDAFCSSTHRLLIRVPYTVKGVEAIGEYITDALVDAGMGWVFDVLEAQQPVAQTA